MDFGDPYPSEPALFRPALVVGPVPKFGARFPNVLVVPITTTYRDLDFHIEIETSPSNGLIATRYAQCELLRSVSTMRLVNKLGLLISNLRLQSIEFFATFWVGEAR